VVNERLGRRDRELRGACYHSGGREVESRAGGEVLWAGVAACLLNAGVLVAAVQVSEDGGLLKKGGRVARELSEARGVSASVRVVCQCSTAAALGPMANQTALSKRRDGGSRSERWRTASASRACNWLGRNQTSNVICLQLAMRAAGCWSAAGLSDWTVARRMFDAGPPVRGGCERKHEPGRGRHSSKLQTWPSI
jgi:hypothetical protein